MADLDTARVLFRQIIKLLPKQNGDKLRQQLDIPDTPEPSASSYTARALYEPPALSGGSNQPPGKYATEERSSLYSSEPRSSPQNTASNTRLNKVDISPQVQMVYRGFKSPNPNILTLTP